MTATSRMIAVEGQSLKDLRKLVEKCKEWSINMTVIGGYAVRGYTNAYRHTKDIDLAIEKESSGNFRGLLKSLGYAASSTEFGIAATKNFESDSMAVHISVGRIYDISTQLSYPITKQLFKDSKTVTVKARYSENNAFNTDAPIVHLNTLLLLKLIPKGRSEKDGVDIVSLLIDRLDEVVTSDIAKMVSQANLVDHLRSQIHDFAKVLNEGKIEKTWSEVTGTSLSGSQIGVVRKFLRALDEKLRSSENRI